MKIGRPKAEDPRKPCSCRINSWTHDFLKNYPDGIGRGIDYLYDAHQKKGGFYVTEDYLRSFVNQFVDMLMRCQNNG